MSIGGGRRWGEGVPPAKTEHQLAGETPAPQSPSPFAACAPGLEALGSSGFGVGKIGPRTIVLAPPRTYQPDAQVREWKDNEVQAQGRRPCTPPTEHGLSAFPGLISIFWLRFQLPRLRVGLVWAAPPTQITAKSVNCGSTAQIKVVELGNVERYGRRCKMFGISRPCRHGRRVLRFRWQRTTGAGSAESRTRAVPRRSPPLLAAR